MPSSAPLVEVSPAPLRPQRVWSLRRRDLRPATGLLLALVRVPLLALYRFRLNGLALQAPALTLYALLAVVPAAAVALAIAKGFGFQEVLENELLRLFHGQDQIAAWVIGTARSFLAGTRGSLLAVAGSLVLLWSVGRMLGHIEACFNAIWEVSGRRSLERRLGDYLLLLCSGPLLLVASGSTVLFVAGSLGRATRHHSWLQAASPLLLSLLDLAPVVLTATFLTLLYLLLPNTRVRPFSALLAGSIAAIVHQAAQRLLVAFQIGAAQASALYGSLAALPLFLIWLQLSWWIVLHGAELAYAHEYAHEWEGLAPWRGLGAHGRRVAALAICGLIGHRFASAHPPSDLPGLAAALDLPQRLVREILGQLVRGGVLQCVAPQRGNLPAYLPAHSFEHLRLGDVLRVLEGSAMEVHHPDDADDRLSTYARVLAAFDAASASSPANLLLLAIAPHDNATPGTQAR
jgi:membrane protein